METQKTEAKKFVLNYGVLLGILAVLMGVITYVMNLHLNPGVVFNIIGFLVIVVVIALAIKAFKQENNGFLRLGEAIKVGVGVALIGGIISALWMFLLINFIEPDYMVQMEEFQREMMVEQNPNMTEDQLEQSMEFVTKFNSPIISMAVVLITYMFLGLIISLIIGLIMKKENPYLA